jgi:hypothetical protein
MSYKEQQKSEISRKKSEKSSDYIGEELVARRRFTLARSR